MSPKAPQKASLALFFKIENCSFVNIKINFCHKWCHFWDYYLFYFSDYLSEVSPNPLAVAIVERLEPRAEKKFPKVSISSLLRLLEIATEISPASATSSHPDKVDKKLKIHDNPYKSPLYLYEITGE